MQSDADHRSLCIATRASKSACEADPSDGCKSRKRIQIGCLINYPCGLTDANRSAVCSTLDLARRFRTRRNPAKEPAGDASARTGFGRVLSFRMAAKLSLRPAEFRRHRRASGLARIWLVGEESRPRRSFIPEAFLEQLLHLNSRSLSY